MDTTELDNLRQQIRDTDDAILKLASQRMSLCREVGEFKEKYKLPIKDFKIEKRIIENARLQAKKINMFSDLAEELMQTLIRFSVMEQDELIKSKKQEKSSLKNTVLIIGGNGLMGKWLSQFFDSLGFDVTINDKSKPSGENCFSFAKNLDQAVNGKQFIIFATPLSETAAIMNKVIDLKPKGMLIDICSLKSPILETLAKAKSQKIRTVSIHPMFGPDVELLSGRNVILCTDKNEEDLEAVESIFRETSARIIRVPLETHDPLMSFVLGSAHLTNLIFASTMANSNLQLSEFENVAGTTFGKQIAVTKDVIRENQDLYYEIQNFNKYTPQLFKSLQETVSAFQKALTHSNRQEFKTLMSKAQKYFRD